MEIVKRINFKEISQDTTNHVLERTFRFSVYEQTFGKGQTIASFVVDKNHPNGNEVHVLKNNRLIYIYNERTHKLITVLYARDGQIRRYFKSAPMHLFDTYQQGFNQI